MIRLLLPAFTIVAALWAARIVNPSELGDRFRRIEDWLRRPGGGPLAAFVATIVVVWLVWGAWRPAPFTFEESSYVLQAEIFARLHWSLPTPPMPEFFEQPHVLVTPVLASKFPPGHALLLALGALVRFDALVPLVVAGATGALIMLLATRLANPWVAILTWMIWITSPMVLRFQPSYFADPTTTALVLLAWWSLLQWRARRKRPWLVTLAVALAWGVITEPMTTLAFAIPIAILVSRSAARTRGRTQWIALGISALAAVVVIGILPLWSARTTGDRTLTPTALYTRDYLPVDKPGFTPDTTTPQRELSPVLQSLYDELLRQHQRQQLRDLPRTMGERLGAIAHDIWRGSQIVLLPFFIFGLFRLTREQKFALASVALMYLVYLPYAHPPSWTLYYLPFAPVIAATTAWGVWQTLMAVTRGVIVKLHLDRRPMLGTLLVMMVLAFFAVPTIAMWRAQHAQVSSGRVAFEQGVRQLPATKSIVFVRYGRKPQHLSLVQNHIDLQRTPVWVVHDLGAKNGDLAKMALDRTPYVFDEDRMEFRRYQ